MQTYILIHVHVEEPGHSLTSTPSYSENRYIPIIKAWIILIQEILNLLITTRYVDGMWGGASSRTKVCHYIEESLRLNRLINELHHEVDAERILFYGRYCVVHYVKQRVLFRSTAGVQDLQSKLRGRRYLCCCVIFQLFLQ
jgi:hypothetical protein